jgi:hypothetical protein
MFIFPFLQFDIFEIELSFFAFEVGNGSLKITFEPFAIVTPFKDWIVKSWIHYQPAFVVAGLASHNPMATAIALMLQPHLGQKNTDD